MTELIRCEKCPNRVGPLVGTRGPEDSPLVIIGESPGVMEMRSKDKIPFIGPSGDIINRACKQHPDLEPYFTNASQCFPGTTKSKSQEKTIAATQCCQQRLHDDIRKHPRKVILALGNAALWSITNNFSHKITQVRGKRFPTDLAEVGCVAAVHPSFLLHGGGSWRQFMGDVDYAMELSKGRDIRKPIIPKYHVIENTDHLEWLEQELKTKEYCAADTETGGYDGFDHLRDHILCAGYAWDPHDVYVVPEGLTGVSHVLFNNDCRFIWHNGKFDAKFYRAGGVHNVRVDEDTMLLSYALDEVKGLHDLEQVSSDLIASPDWKYMIKPYLVAEKQRLRGTNKEPTYDCIPRPVLYDYMARDISATLQVFPILRRNVQQNSRLEQLYQQTLLRQSTYFTRVEEIGLKVDLKQVEKNSTRLLLKVNEYRDEINRIAVAHGIAEINPNSPTQLVPFLYDTLKIKTKHRDTAEDTLIKLEQHPAVVALLKYRTVAKSESTYVRSLPGFLGPDGRVHQTYLIHGTTTGRPACRNPNVLNIPRDPELRGQFVAADNCIYLEVDANQAELRVLAELSGDQELCRIYLTEGMSIHDEVRNDLFGIPKTYTPEELAYQLNKFKLTPETRFDGKKDLLVAEQKMRAKNVNFGIPYGITAAGLAEQIDDTIPEAQSYLTAWAKRFSGASKFILKCREAVVTGKLIFTPFGRERRFGVVGPDRVIDQQNQAANFPEQSIASDLVTHTGMEMQSYAEHMYKAYICNTVYDSILFEMPDDEETVRALARETLDLLPRIALKWGMTRVPFIGEAKVGKRWGSLTPIDEYYQEQKKAVA